jgi:multidrug efflux pump subunit AcrB
VNIYTQIGLVTLIELISKHGILMVAFANEIQVSKGYDRHAAIVEAASVRMRPILMTTAAIVAGLVPLGLCRRGGGREPLRHRHRCGHGHVDRHDVHAVRATNLSTS